MSNSNNTPKKEPKTFGHRLAQMKRDLEDSSLSKEQKALKYSEYLYWLQAEIGNLYQATVVQGAPGMWDQSPYMHGFCNGLIVALSFFFEHEDPPVKKRPASYKNDDNAIAKIQLAEYIEILESLLNAIFRSDHHGPFGYGHLEDPWSEWRKDVLQEIDAAPVETKEMMSERDKMFDWAKENLDTGEEQ